MIQEVYGTYDSVSKSMIFNRKFHIVFCLRRTNMTKALSKVFSLALVLALVVAALPLQVVNAAPTELFFTEYIEGSSNNKALEIYNGTGMAVTLTSAYNIQMYFNGSSTA